MKVLVTGANGFLGRHVVAELLKNGYPVRALVRSKEKFLKCPIAKKVEIFEADLRFSKGLESSFRDVSVLIHLAASKSGDEEEQFESTVVGTERLLEAMSKTSVRRIIFCSSLSVYDRAKLKSELTENTPIDHNPYARDGYSISKIWQERVVRKASRLNGWDLTVLRPGMIWGEPKEYPLVLSIPLGIFHLVIGPLKKPNLIDVKSCAKAFVKAVSDDKSIGMTYNLINNFRLSSWSFMGKYLEAANIPGIRIPVPYSIAYPIIRCIYGLSSWVLSQDLNVPSIAVPRRFESRFKPFTCSLSQSKQLLGEKQNQEIIASFEELKKSANQEADSG